MRPIETLTRLTFTRRELLRLLVPLSAWLPTPVLLAAAACQAKHAPAAFGLFLDTILPEDESPSLSIYANSLRAGHYVKVHGLSGEIT